MPKRASSSRAYPPQWSATSPIMGASNSSTKYPQKMHLPQVLRRVCQDAHS
ncbi:hypothetical protein C2845_PM08G05230 [Panicum miliaceum]|uniref:Uncharacterized protein n=1 Tax=Panicum miliaceum TaxID=4540 RepID=A0A3L6R480_PANMI|nr:hypothetical protein C2845_PM08G05230 [Panicum miliaceum]